MNPLNRIHNLLFYCSWLPVLYNLYCSGQSFNGITSITDMHRYCLGTCYYFPEGETVTEGSSEFTTPCRTDASCAAVLSIVKFEPQNCSANLQSELNRMFCCEGETRKADLFHVTMALNIKDEDRACFEFRSDCVPLEFIAVAFTTNSNLDPQIDDPPFYTCISRTAYVQSIQQYKNNTKSTQMAYTSPFPRIATGVFWSDISYGTDGSLVCQFIISSNEYEYILPADVEAYESEKRQNLVNIIKSIPQQNLTENLIYELQKNLTTEILPTAKNARECIKQTPGYYNRDMNKTKATTFNFGDFGKGAGWDIKLARGHVVREGKLHAVVDVPINNTVSSTLVLGTGKYLSDRAKMWSVSKKLKKSEILTSLKSKVVDPSATDTAKPQNKMKMEKVYKNCIDRKSLCYTQQRERGCLHKQNCHLLIAITDTSKTFDLLHFDLIIQTPESPGEQRYIRPKGWGAFGFSKDKVMGGDFVIVCAAYGRSTKVYPTVNVGRSNLYFPTQADYAKESNKASFVFKNRNEIIWKREPELEPRVMCSFDMKTNLSISNLPIKRDDTPYNLKGEEFFILMAQGTGVNTEDWAIAYHTRANREVSDVKFSREIYKSATTSTGSSMRGQWMILFIGIKFLNG